VLLQHRSVLDVWGQSGFAPLQHAICAIALAFASAMQASNDEAGIATQMAKTIKAVRARARRIELTLNRMMEDVKRGRRAAELYKYRERVI
jgi:hypothetical protein